MKRERIESGRTVMMGKPVIAGTRIRVELILEKLVSVKRSGKFWMFILVYRKRPSTQRWNLHECLTCRYSPSDQEGRFVTQPRVGHSHGKEGRFEGASADPEGTATDSKEPTG